MFALYPQQLKYTRGNSFFVRTVKFSYFHFVFQCIFILFFCNGSLMEFYAVGYISYWKEMSGTSQSSRGVFLCVHLWDVLLSSHGKRKMVLFIRQKNYPDRHRECRFKYASMPKGKCLYWGVFTGDKSLNLVSHNNGLWGRLWKKNLTESGTTSEVHGTHSLLKCHLWRDIPRGADHY